MPLQVSAPVLALILDDGQAFRWHPLPDATWLGFWGSYVARLSLDSQDQLCWSAPVSLESATGAALHRYLALDLNYDDVMDRLPWRSDRHLATCITAFPGLRLLRQPFGETLLCFLCSATKQIVQIKQMTELLAHRIGKPILEQMPRITLAPQLSFHRLPTWAELAQSSEAELRSCALGFRASYVKSTAAFLQDKPGWLEETESLPYADAHARLCQLPGVGAKIADCVLLYGGGALQAFPVDTWIIKVMARHYALTGWKPEAVSHFGRMHFGPAAGLAQQFLFNFERKEARLMS